MNDALRSFLTTLRADPHPTPDYRVIHSTHEIYDYMAVEGEPEQLELSIAEDTESLPSGAPYCLTFSVRPGTGRLIYGKDLHLIEEYAHALHHIEGSLWQLTPFHIFHNYLHDIVPFEHFRIPVPPTRFRDTMVMAYHLCLGGGGDQEDEGMAGRGSLSLKALAFRHLNMQMTSFKDTVYPHSLPLVLAWLRTARAALKPDEWVPHCATCNHPQSEHERRGRTLRHIGRCHANLLCECERFKAAKKPKQSPDDSLHRKLHNLITKVERGERDSEDVEDGALNVVDPWKLLRKWDAGDLGMLEGLLGPMPVPSIAYVPEKDLLSYACLAKESLVLTESGYRRIHELVRDKYDGKVFSVDPSGRIVKNRVTGWHRIKSTTPIHWLSVETRHSKVGRWGVMATRYTPDHKLLTKSGMVEISAIRPGDKLCLPFERLNSNQLQVTLGSLLGDGSITIRNKRSGMASLSVSHCIKQKRYLDWKKEIMRDLLRDEYSSPAGPRADINGRPVIATEHHTFTTTHHPEFSDYRELSYPERGKRTIGDWIAKMDGLGLAIAYQDNGTLVNHKTARIYVQRFDTESVDRFREHLLETFGIHSTRYECNRGGWAMHIAARSSTTFFNLIKQHVHPDLAYKLPTEFKTELVTPTPVKFGMYYAEVLRVYDNPASKGRRGSTYVSYCLDVEHTHNFLTLNEVAKNCRDADATLRLYHYLSGLRPWVFY